MDRARDLAQRQKILTSHRRKKTDGLITGRFFKRLICSDLASEGNVVIHVIEPTLGRRCGRRTLRCRSRRTRGCSGTAVATFFTAPTGATHAFAAT